MEFALCGGKHCAHPGVLLSVIKSSLDPDPEIGVSARKFAEE